MSQCAGDCQSNETQAIDYMNASIAWSTIYREAWTNPDVLKTLIAHKDNANQAIIELAQKLGITPPRIPEGVVLKLVFDSTAVVHLTMPAFENIPPSPLMMVPYAI